MKFLSAKGKKMKIKRATLKVNKFKRSKNRPATVNKKINYIEEKLVLIKINTEENDKIATWNNYNLS